mmetsp:Transcript_97182/g.279740  ORF Transcript_97182/g.279740 Transcript_97182/m.279740 type:complete len:214 (+) Transcript_97182:111-752(+)
MLGAAATAPAAGAPGAGGLPTGAAGQAPSCSEEVARCRCTPELLELDDDEVLISLLALRLLEPAGGAAASPTPTVLAVVSASPSSPRGRSRRVRATAADTGAPITAATSRSATFEEESSLSSPFSESPPEPAAAAAAPNSPGEPKPANQRSAQSMGTSPAKVSVCDSRLAHARLPAISSASRWRSSRDLSATTCHPADLLGKNGICGPNMNVA